MNAQEQIAAFEQEYEPQEREILVLMHGGGGGVKRDDFWERGKGFLAYVDTATGTLEKGEGHVTWLISDADYKVHDLPYPYEFVDGKIYRLKARKFSDQAVSPGGSSAFYNRFMVLEVLERDVQHDAQYGAQYEEFQAILADYLQPVTVTDTVLGTFDLNKEYNFFEGSITWSGKKVSVLLQVDAKDPTTWTAALHTLRTMCDGQQQRDARYRAYAAQKLTASANDWSQDEDEHAITEQDFIEKISLAELTVAANGNFTAYYDDGDLFYGHAVAVDGNVYTDVLKDAYTAG